MVPVFMVKNPRSTIPCPSGKGQGGLSGRSKSKLSPKGGERVLRKRSKIREWMGTGLPRKRKQHNEAPKYKIFNVSVRKGG